MSEENANLVNKCLIATPAIKDPLFASSLVYMCEHNEKGSMGLVINHPTTQNLEEIFDQLHIECKHEEIRKQPVYLGGPVKLEQGFVLHTSAGNWQKSIEISSKIYLTSSMDILESIAANNGPKEYMVILGFSGWASGQLESELHENSWLTSSADANLLFHQSSDDKWQVAFDTLGFDLSSLSPVSGNA
ncbi:MAG: YqgE/AlgH family protein [Gammaproteobacteria bacterium]|nr:YqgE/AlgH family protein [Gammaproteobacteria bacterium]